jgi:hypothetical protein
MASRRSSAERRRGERGTETNVGAREWVLLAVVVLVPLAIAAAVTLWSLEQARYRPKAKGTVRTSSGASRRRPPAANGDGAASEVEADAASGAREQS